MRMADVIPECLVSDGVEIDEDSCKSFFAARRAVILGEGGEGEVPLTPLPMGVHQRWQDYIFWKADGGKGPFIPQPRKVGRPRTTTEEGSPWEAEGVSKATWYRRRGQEG